MKFQDIPDYLNKRIRKRTWVPKAYMEYRDGEWWANTLHCGKGYVLAKHAGPDNSYNDWEEYYDWKGEMLEELHEFRRRMEKCHYDIMNDIWKLKDKIEKL